MQSAQASWVVVRFFAGHRFHLFVAFTNQCCPSQTLHLRYEPGKQSKHRWRLPCRYLGTAVYTTYQCWRPHKTILSCLIWFDGLAWENKTHWYPFISMKIPLYHHWKSIFQSANASGAVWPCLASRPRWVALQNHGTYAGFLQLLRKPSAWHPARVEELCRQGDWWDWMGTDGNWWEHVDDGVLPFNLVVLVRFFEVFGGLK